MSNVFYIVLGRASCELASWHPLPTPATKTCRWGPRVRGCSRVGGLARRVIAFPGPQMRGTGGTRLRGCSRVGRLARRVIAFPGLKIETGGTRLSHPRRKNKNAPRVGHPRVGADGRRFPRCSGLIDPHPSEAWMGHPRDGNGWGDSIQDLRPRPTRLAAAMMTRMPVQRRRRGREATPFHSPSARPTRPPQRT
jgi:hypothetical protein